MLGSSCHFLVSCFYSVCSFFIFIPGICLLVLWIFVSFYLQKPFSHTQTICYYLRWNEKIVCDFAVFARGLLYSRFVSICVCIWIRKFPLFFWFFTTCLDVLDAQCVFLLLLLFIRSFVQLLVLGLNFSFRLIFAVAVAFSLTLLSATVMVCVSSDVYWYHMGYLNVLDVFSICYFFLV